MQVKNPWCHMRWKGDFSPGDERNWTPELKAAVQYDREAAQEVDNGIFWLSWEVVLAFYSSIHCSWSPARFGVRRSVHGYWTKVTVAPNLLDFPHNFVPCTEQHSPPKYCTLQSLARPHRFTDVCRNGMAGDTRHTRTASTLTITLSTFCE